MIFGEKKVIEHECVLIFSNLCLKHFSFKKNSERYYHKCIQLQVQHPLGLSVKKNLKFLDKFFEIS